MHVGMQDNNTDECKWKIGLFPDLSSGCGRWDLSGRGTTG